MEKKKTVIVTGASQGTGPAIVASGLANWHGIDNDDEPKPGSQGNQPTASGMRFGAGPCHHWRNVRVGLF
jgi:NAD(P)-dependent dehydrogenase (short-subunit alcohol dehydrogenase family)